MSTCTWYYVDFMDDFSWFLVWLYVGYKNGSMTSSNYGSYPWFDKHLNGLWMDGLISVVENTWKGIKPSWWF